MVNYFFSFSLVVYRISQQSITIGRKKVNSVILVSPLRSLVVQFRSYFIVHAFHVIQIDSRVFGPLGIQITFFFRHFNVNILDCATFACHGFNRFVRHEPNTMYKIVDCRFCSWIFIFKTRLDGTRRINFLTIQVGIPSLVLNSRFFQQPTNTKHKKKKIMQGKSVSHGSIIGYVYLFR